MTLQAGVGKPVRMELTPTRNSAVSTCRYLMTR